MVRSKRGDTPNYDAEALRSGRLFSWAMAGAFGLLGVVLLAMFFEGGPPITGLGIVAGPLSLAFSAMLIRGGFNARRRAREQRPTS